VYDETAVVNNCMSLSRVVEQSGVETLYSVKPLLLPDLLKLIVGNLKGVSTSSLFETLAAREIVGGEKEIHVVAPAYRPDDIEELVDLADYVTFNSFNQWLRFRQVAIKKSLCGLRINPKRSFVADPRYDPCRPSSKLGVSIDQVAEMFKQQPELFNDLTGIHIHNNCDSNDFRHLLETTRTVDHLLQFVLERVDWINLGGGYLFSDPINVDDLHRAVSLLRSKYGLKIYMEPGAALVRNAGLIVSTVLDRFEADGKTVVILDTTVNHMPEVFEYQFEPDILGHADDGEYEYILAGCTCLAGDVFGEYRFNAPLEIGSRIIFQNAGAYTLVKAHMFNGINLPTIYALTPAGDLTLQKQYDYEDFRHTWEHDKDHETIRSVAAPSRHSGKRKSA